MKYEKPNMFVVFIEDSNIITNSLSTGTLIPGIDIEDESGNVDAND